MCVKCKNLLLQHVCAAHLIILYKKKNFRADFFFNCGYKGTLTINEYNNQV